MELIRLKANDYEEAMDFLDIVFSKAHCPHDFGSMLPIIYRPTDEHMNCNFAVRENGKIRGIVGLFPMEMKIGDQILTVGGIGGVSAHPKDKGKGWMKMLMKAAVDEMKENGTDLSWLGGLRHRYQHYGYEVTGIMLEYDVSKTNLRHVYGSSEMPNLRFVPITEKDTDYLRKAKELHDRQPIHCVRSMEDYWLFLTVVYTTPWAVLDEEGNMVGYLVLKQDKTCITELFAENDEILEQMVRLWVSKQEQESVKVKLAPWQDEIARRLGCLAEEFRVTDSGNYQIFNWDKVVACLLTAKNQQECLPDGKLLLGIEEYGTLEICVKNGEVDCKKTEEAAEVVLGSFAAMRTVFGKFPVHFVADIPVHAKQIMNAWFPLPLCWMVQDHV